MKITLSVISFQKEKMKKKRGYHILPSHRFLWDWSYRMQNSPPSYDNSPPSPASILTEQITCSSSSSVGGNHEGTALVRTDDSRKFFACTPLNELLCWETDDVRNTCCVFHYWIQLVPWLPTASTWLITFSRKKQWGAVYKVMNLRSHEGMAASQQGSFRFLQWNRWHIIRTTFDAQWFASIPTDRPMAVEASLVPPILGAFFKVTMHRNMVSHYNEKGEIPVRETRFESDHRAPTYL